MPPISLAEAVFVLMDELEVLVPICIPAAMDPDVEEAAIDIPDMSMLELMLEDDAAATVEVGITMLELILISDIDIVVDP